MFTRDVWQATEVVTAPAAEPHVLAEVLFHLRVDVDTPDLDDIKSKQAQARDCVEQHLGEALYKQTRRLTLGRFPCYIQLPIGPVLAVSSVKYLDVAGTQQTLSSTLYHVDLPGGTIEPAIGAAWPETADLRGAVVIEWIAGYTDGNADPLASPALPAIAGDPLKKIPPRYKAALLLWISHLYENREAVTTGAQAMALPMGVDALLGGRARV